MTMSNTKSHLCNIPERFVLTDFNIVITYMQISLNLILNHINFFSETIDPTKTKLGCDCLLVENFEDFI